MSTRPRARKTAIVILDDERFGAAAVIERLKQALGVASDSALADALRTTRQNVSKWKARETVPYAEAVFVSFLKNVSLDYLLAGDVGEGTKLRQPSKLDEDIVRAILLNLHGFGLIDPAKGRDAKEAIQSAAQAIVFQYARADQVVRELMEKKGLSADDARAAAVLATELIGSDGTLFGARTPGEGRVRNRVRNRRR